MLESLAKGLGPVDFPLFMHLPRYDEDVVFVEDLLLEAKMTSVIKQGASHRCLKNTYDECMLVPKKYRNMTFCSLFLCSDMVLPLMKK